MFVGNFCEGMLVNYLSYGMGMIFKISGVGNKRIVLVEFYSEGLKMFCLVFSFLILVELKWVVW